mmetsp:Transcript_25718/g.61250  ORF Transcript_25718/g.61250 Transcript_25718/m.61250 type:complete len:345 (-) Transcript_25718:2137-3171(-)
MRALYTTPNPPSPRRHFRPSAALHIDISSRAIRSSWSSAGMSSSRLVPPCPPGPLPKSGLPLPAAASASAWLLDGGSGDCRRRASLSSHEPSCSEVDGVDIANLLAWSRVSRDGSSAVPTTSALRMPPSFGTLRSLPLQAPTSQPPALRKNRSSSRTSAEHSAPTTMRSNNMDDLRENMSRTRNSTARCGRPRNLFTDSTRDLARNARSSLTSTAVTWPSSPTRNAIIAARKPAPDPKFITRCPGSRQRPSMRAMSTSGGLGCSAELAAPPEPSPLPDARPRSSVKRVLGIVQKACSASGQTTVCRHASSSISASSDCRLTSSSTARATVTELVRSWSMSEATS